MSFAWEGEDYEMCGGRVIPDDFLPAMEQLDRERAVKRSIGKCCFFACLLFIAVGTGWVYWSWR